MEKLVFKFLDDYLGNEFGVTEMVLYDPYNFTPKRTINVLSKKEGDLCILQIVPTPTEYLLSDNKSRAMKLVADFFSLNDYQANFLVKSWFLIKLGVPYNKIGNFTNEDVNYAIMKLYRILNREFNLGVVSINKIHIQRI
jgi:hypothetical protein